MNKNKIFKYIFICFFLVFLIAYIIEETGYYEYKLQNKTILTKEAMEQFEEDVKNGEEIDLNDYQVEEEIDYTNSLTKQTNKVSQKVNNYFKKGIEGVFSFLNKLIQE